MKDEIIKNVIYVDHEHFHKLWLKYKNNDTADLTGEEKQLVEIMQEHKDQCGVDSKNNWFFHIAMHYTLENQIDKKEPIEAYQFVLSMRNRGSTYHDAIHLAEAILAHLLSSVLNNNTPFDWDRYKFLLRKYKNRKPLKITALLDREFVEPGNSETVEFEFDYSRKSPLQIHGFNPLSGSVRG